MGGIKKGAEKERGRNAEKPRSQARKIVCSFKEKERGSGGKTITSVTKRYPSQTRHSKGRTLSEYMTKL